MNFDAMSKYNHNEPVEHLWAVAKNGLVPVRKYKVLKEGAKTFILEDGTTVRKCEMRNVFQLFFTNEESAEATYRGLRKAFDPAYADTETNFDRIKDAPISDLSNILLDMIFELCEECVPTREDIENWLTSATRKEETRDHDVTCKNQTTSNDRLAALDVAKYVVNTCIEIGHPISNSCLQHVLYELYKAAFRRGNTLFYDEFEASAVGPRISAVYDNFCAWGAWPITMEQKESDNPNKQIPEQFQDLFKVIICATVNTSLYDWIENAKHGGSAWYRSYVAKSTWIPGAAIHQEVAGTKDVYDNMLRNMQKDGLV